LLYDPKDSIPFYWQDNIFLKNNVTIEHHIDIKPRHILKGRITDTNGKPVPNLRLIAFWRDEPHITYRSFAKTDANGEYTLTGICETVWQLDSSNPDWQFTTKFNLKADAEPANFTISESGFRKK
jgi:protocatechuate 3,4-dioxygenase beta subunit